MSLTVVLDTNVLASGAVAAAGPIFRIMESWRRWEFVNICSDYILGELNEVVDKPYFRDRVAAEDRSAFLTLVEERSFMISTYPDAASYRAERKDDPILTAAATGRAKYLVTGDEGLLALRRHGSTEILRPREFAAVLVARRRLVNSLQEAA